MSLHHTFLESATLAKRVQRLLLPPPSRDASSDASSSVSFILGSFRVQADPGCDYDLAVFLEDPVSPVSVDAEYDPRFSATGTRFQFVVKKNGILLLNDHGERAGLLGNTGITGLCREAFLWAPMMGSGDLSIRRYAMRPALPDYLVVDPTMIAVQNAYHSLLTELDCSLSRQQKGE